MYWHTHTHTQICKLKLKREKHNGTHPAVRFALQTKHQRPYFYDTYPTLRDKVVVLKGFGMWVASVQTNTTSPNALISPSSLTHACSTSAKSEQCLFVSVAVGQDSSKRPWTTNTDTHSLGSLSCPPIKGVYRRPLHDVIPAPNAKLITTMGPGMCICVYVDVCEEFHMSK